MKSMCPCIDDSGMYNITNVNINSKIWWIRNESHMVPYIDDIGKYNINNVNNTIENIIFYNPF